MSADITADPAIGATSIAFPRHEQTFPTLTDSEIERMRRFGELRTYRHGEALFETGKVGPGMFVVLSGTVSRSPSATALAMSPLSSTRGRGSFSPRSASFPAVSRWSTAMPRATSKRC